MLAAASKTFNIPGLQQSMAVSFNSKLLEKLRSNMEMQGVTSGNVFALEGTIAAYTQCDDWLDGMLVYLDESRRIITEEIPHLLPKAILTPIEATALAWVDLSAYEKNSAALEKKIRAQHVVLNAGTLFDAEQGEGFMRLNFACPHEALREGLRRLARALG